MELNTIIEKLEIAFKRNDVKKEVLTDEWYDKNMSSGIDSTGFCYVASEVIYRMTGGKSVWKKVSITDSKWEHGGHCFLINKQTNQILDVTKNQFTELGITIPYHIGIGGGFRTKDYGTRAKKLAIMADLM